MDWKPTSQTILDLHRPELPPRCGWLAPLGRHGLEVPSSPDTLQMGVPTCPHHWRTTNNQNILWMEEILHQLIDGLSYGLSVYPIIYMVYHTVYPII